MLKSLRPKANIKSQVSEHRYVAILPTVSSIKHWKIARCVPFTASKMNNKTRLFSSRVTFNGNCQKRSADMFYGRVL